MVVPEIHVDDWQESALKCSFNGLETSKRGFACKSRLRLQLAHTRISRRASLSTLHYQQILAEIRRFVSQSSGLEAVLIFFFFVDKCDPATWKTPGIRAKAAFDFMARNRNELTVQTNDEVTLAPTYIQEEMQLKNSGWAYAVSNGRSGVVPLNYLVINKAVPKEGLPVREEVPVPRVFGNNTHHKTHTKRVSFGENQIFENVDLDDYVTGKKGVKEVDDTVKDNNVDMGQKDLKAENAPIQVDSTETKNVAVD